MKLEKSEVVRGWALGAGMGLLAIFLSGCNGMSRVEKSEIPQGGNHMVMYRVKREAPTVPPRKISPVVNPNSISSAFEASSETDSPLTESEEAEDKLLDAPPTEVVRAWAESIVREEPPEGFDQYDFSTCTERLLVMMMTGDEMDKMSALRVLQALCRCETTEEEEAEESEFDEEDAFAVTTLVHQGLLDASPAVRAVAAQVLSTLPTTEREMVSLVALGGDDDDVKKSVLALDDGLLEKYAAIWVEDEVATMEVAVDE